MYTLNVSNASRTTEDRFGLWNKVVRIFRQTKTDDDDQKKT